MKILITAGPTREPIDAVRFITNRSSGKTGLALIRAAVWAGHDVVALVGGGNTPLDLGWGDASAKARQCRVERFWTTDELADLLEAHWPGRDLLIMSAAVADYRLRHVEKGKIPRRPDRGLSLELEPTPDLVQRMAKLKRPDQRIIAFALEEPEHLMQRAMDKLQRKGVDAIVANPMDTLDSDWISPVWLTAGADRQSPGRMTKPDFARWLIDMARQL